MKFVFFGSPEFASMVLRKIIAAGFVPDALVCNPDRPAGRKKIITPPETKKLIASEGLAGLVKILQPEKPAEVIPALQELQPDFCVVAAYAKIIPKSVLAVPRLGTIGVHPSLLPKYRGASPIQSALLAGEKETGVALYLLGPGLDDGPILAVNRLPIADSDDYELLLPKLAELGGGMLAELIPEFRKGGVRPAPQDESRATFTKKFTADDGFVEDLDLRAAMETGVGADELHNKIRALGAEPGVWTMRGGKRLKLLSSEVLNGKLRLRQIQWEGKTPENFI